ncbi:MAG: phage minor head protein [Alphaproteobacteria bacterium]
MADPRPITEAVDFLRTKARLPTRKWTDLWQGQHARGFVVAGVVKDGLLADIQGELVKALEDGRSFDSFKKDFGAILDKWKWEPEQGRGWRARVIFDTNIRTAHAAARWDRMKAAQKRRPFLRYSAVLDERTREDHKAWHGTILPITDAWWETHYPPNGWYCRCTVQQLSQRDLDRRGLSVSQPPQGALESRSIRRSDGGDPVPVQVPKGIDTGFAHNVGIANSGRAQAVRLDSDATRFPKLTVPGGNVPKKPGALAIRTSGVNRNMIGKDEAALRKALQQVIGKDPSRVLTDPIGGRVILDQRIVDHMLEDPARIDGRQFYFGMIPDLVERPQEIWAGFVTDASTGRVSLRKRYVSLFQDKNKRSFGLVADQQGSEFRNLTLFRGDPTNLLGLRVGLRLFSELEG